MPAFILFIFLIGSNYVWYVAFTTYRRTIKEELKKRGIVPVKEMKQ